MKKFKTPSILIFFWFSIFLLTKDLIPTQGKLGFVDFL